MAIATPQELAAAQKTARHSLLSYVVSSMPLYDVAEHHLVLMDHLEAVERGDLRRLMVTMPPRHGKSELVSRRFPAWYLGRNPESEIIIASYGADLAQEFSRSVREQFRDVDWPFDVELKRGQQRVKHWGLEGHRGSLAAAGVGGATTGKGAQIFIIDDPVKDQEAADSPTIREKTWNWYRSVAHTRLTPDGAIIIVQTRWHAGDLSGLLLEEAKVGEGDQWTLLEMPALAFETEELAPGLQDPLGRSPGEALWPSQFSREALLEKQRAVGARTWSALYQQRPTTGQGQVFKRSWMNHRYQYVNQLQLNRVIITVDSAFKEGTGTSFSTAAVWGQTDTHLVVLDVWRDRVGWDDLVQAVKDIWHNWDQLLPGITPLVIIENKASGQSLIQHLNNSTRIPAQPFPDPDDQAQKKLASSSKEARADQATVPFAGSKVLLPERAPWLERWIKEHVEFPTAVNDDQVDTTSMAVAHLFGTPIPASIATVNPTEHYRQDKGGKDRFGESGYNARRGSGLDLGIRDRARQEGYNARRGKLLG